MSAAKPFVQLLELQKDLYEKSYQEALSLDLLGLGLLGRYAEAYDRSLPDAFLASDLESLVSKISAAKYSLYGDFHTLKQSQRGLLRILRHLPEPNDFVLAMEMFASEEQSVLDAFMSEQISEEEFMEAIQYHSKWGFPWAHYLPILQWAREAKVTVVGINHNGASIEERDGAIARRLLALGNKYKDKKIVVMIGEHHLADQHLPKQLFQKNIHNDDLFRVFTNVEKYYFSKDRVQTRPSEYLDLGKNRFCVLNSPPWIKWQSVTIFSEISTTDIEDVWYDEDFEEESTDDRFHSVLNSLASFLQIEPSAAFDDFYIYRLSSADFFQHLRESFSERLASAFMSVAEEDEVLYPLIGKSLYLAEYTQNNLIQLAGEYLRGLSVELDPKQASERTVCLQVMLSACAGRIASLIFNPRRKGLTVDEISDFLEANSRKRLLGAAKQRRQVLKDLLQLFFRLEDGRIPSESNKIWREDILANFTRVRGLGNIVGQVLYQKIMRGALPKQLMIDLFLSSADPEEILRHVFEQLHQSELKAIA